MAAQNWISVRTQIMSKLYDQQWNCDPKEKNFWDSYCFFFILSLFHTDSMKTDTWKIWHASALFL